MCRLFYHSCLLGFWYYLYSASPSWAGKQFWRACSYCRRYIQLSCNGIHPPGDYLCHNSSNFYLWRLFQQCSFSSVCCPSIPNPVLNNSINLFADLAVSSVSWTIFTALLNVSSSLNTLEMALRTASLPVEQMNHVYIASCCESLIAL